MTSCPTCGFDRGKVVTRGPLRVTTDPPEAYWHGKRMILSPVRAKMLGLLATRGSASNFALSLMCPKDEATYDTVQVHICKLRACLPREITISTVRGFGYRLTMENDMTDTPEAPVTVKATLAAKIADLPDDMTGAILVLTDAGGKIAHYTPSSPVPQVLQMLGLATADYGKRLVRTSQAPG